jgi:hypothetical protein
MILKAQDLSSDRADVSAKRYPPDPLLPPDPKIFFHPASLKTGMEW